MFLQQIHPLQVRMVQVRMVPARRKRRRHLTLVLKLFQSQSLQVQRCFDWINRQNPSDTRLERTFVVKDAKDFQTNVFREYSCWIKSAVKFEEGKQTDNGLTKSKWVLDSETAIDFDSCGSHMQIFDTVKKSQKISLNDVTEEHITSWYLLSKSEPGLKNRLQLKVYPFGIGVKDKAEYEAIKGQHTIVHDRAKAPTNQTVYEIKQKLIAQYSSVFQAKHDVAWYMWANDVLAQHGALAESMIPKLVSPPVGLAHNFILNTSNTDKILEKKLEEVTSSHRVAVRALMIVKEEVKKEFDLIMSFLDNKIGELTSTSVMIQETISSQYYASQVGQQADIDHM